MRISNIKIEKFKGILEANIKLSDINILVGSNASGKSSIIQAIHLAVCLIRQAERVDSKKTTTVGIEQLDYLPSDDIKMLGYKTPWGNKNKSPSSKITFEFTDDSDETKTVNASCEIRSARNAGISITGQIPSDLSSFLRSKQRFFSAYIPGVSGIPNKEEKRSKKVVLKTCSYGDSNVILRNVLLLLKLHKQNYLEKIENWINKIAGPIKLYVEYDEEKSLKIDCSVWINDIKRPIELVGTGYLQLIQLFGYILLFKPGILLVDEPDIHLHPSIQEKLVQVLADVAREQSVRILLTTHSPFIVRGSPFTTNVYWVDKGEIKTNSRREIELALGWGAFGKKIILITEDENTQLTRKLLAQWPQIERLVTIYPGSGFKSLPTPKQAQEISQALGGNFQILIHRDRDSLSNTECSVLISQYEALNIDLWLPMNGDIEAYFCDPEFVSEVTARPVAEIENTISDILNGRQKEITDQFNKQRKAHNQELYPTGGSPPNHVVIKELEKRPLRIASGKYIFNQIKDNIGSKAFDLQVVLKHNIKLELANDLRSKLEEIIKRN